MKSNYPIRKLSTLNLWVTLYFFLFGFAITMANLGLKNVHIALIHSFLGAIILILNTFANLGLLLFFERNLKINPSTNKKKYIALSYVFNLFVFLGVVIIYTTINRRPLGIAIIAYIIMICILINTLVLVLQNYIILQEAKVKADIENSQLKVANADAANQLLRQQIHPHFLFNALNILKSLYRVNPGIGEEYLIRLSNFLRAAVSNHNIKVIALKDEIALCEDYLEMQKIRFGNAFMYSIAISEETLKHGFVPSFSIQPLLENAMKHNELTEEFPLHISIRQEDDRIRVNNTLKLKTSSENNTGSGLANLSERYKILSNDEIIIEETAEVFSVSIKILRYEDSDHRG